MNGVNTAFEILLEEIEEVFNVISKEGEKAFKLKDFDKANSLIEYAERLKVFREKVKALQKEWQKLSENAPAQNEETKARSRLAKGLRTPEDKFYIPILEALIELGGKAKAEDVLKLVREKMKNILNEHDYRSLSSGGIRWKNTAQWARQAMVNEGLLANDSPRGIWKITPKGIEYYLKNL